jgi:type I restriction enzyme, S subunit
MSDAAYPWPTLPLGKLASEMCLGKMLDKEKNRGTLQPYMRNVNVRWFTFDLSDMKEMRFEETEGKRFQLRTGDLVICEGGEPGRCAVWNGQIEDAWIQKALHRVRFHQNEYEATFAMYFLYYGTITGRFESNYTGSTIKHLTSSSLSGVQFPIPPLAEQRRIVAKIEELFAELDAAVEELERVRANLKRYRASVLKAAVMGQLFKIKKQHLCLPLRDMIEGLGQGWSPKCDLQRDTKPDEWGIIKTTAVQSLCYLDQESKPLPSNLAARPHLEIKIGDMLMTRKGPRDRAGVTCLVRATRPRLMICDTVYRFRCVESMVNPAYLAIALNSPHIVMDIDHRKAGINDSGVSLTHQKIGEVLIPLPPLAEQEAIVMEVEARLSDISAAEAAVQANLTRAAKLRQSILKEAFTGRLIPQDPADEPAASLLEGIRSKKSPILVNEAVVDLLAFAVPSDAGIGKLNRTKVQKFACILQTHHGVAVVERFLQAPFGPYAPEIPEMEPTCEQRGYFTAKLEPIGGKKTEYQYHPGENSEAGRAAGLKRLGKLASDAEKLLRHIRTMTTEEAELFATVYAVWNDLLLGRHSADEDAIIAGVYAWNVQKKKFPQKAIVARIAWMREAGYVPVGRGKPTLPSTPSTKSKRKQRG